MTTAAVTQTGEGRALRVDEIVTIKGKQYQVTRLQDSVWVRQCAGMDFAAQPVNKKTGKGWQAERRFKLSDIEADLSDAIRITKAAAAKADAAASRWYYKPNTGGGFDVFHNDERFAARMAEHYPNSSTAQWDARVLSNVTEAVAKAHVEMALNHERANAERQALIGHLFNKENWKLATERAVARDLFTASRMRDALAHFCGGAEIHCLPGGKYSVGSAGYYHYVGA